MPRVIASGRADADGKTLRFVLASRSSCMSARSAAAPWWTWRRPISPAPCRTWRRRAKPAPKPVDVAALPEIKLRAGAYENFTRLVFDWPKDVPYQVFPGAGK